MNQQLEIILKLIQESEQLNASEKKSAVKAIIETVEELTSKKRELEIENSLKQVRAVALNMRQSDDLLKVCESVFTQLKALGFSDAGLRNTQIVINNDAQGFYYGYQYSDYIGGEIAEVPYNLHPVIKMLNDKLRQSNDAFAGIEISGKDLDDWKAFVKKFPQKPDEKLDASKELHYYFYSVGIGALGISTFQTLSEEKLKILQRLRNVFKLSYQRYTDIKQAEAQAKEARIEASLERMRAVAMSMRKTEDLIEVCQSMYSELKNLSFTNIRNAQIVIKDQGKETYYVNTYSDDVTLSIHEHPSDTSPIIQELYNELDKSKDSIYHKELAGKEFEDWRSWRMSISSSEDKKLNQVDSICFYLYSIEAGHMGISTFNTIATEQLEILKRFKNVFELSFTRFSDLQIAEKHAVQARLDLIQLQTEKKRAENAFADLRTTQTQLVQSEKMASLGALTAGIAHEIKNPLNFINNFSDLSTDLVDEFLHAKDDSERKEIAEDLKKNLGIINEHGKRADSIVKNMLEHSRTGTGKKQLTNINQLCDEFFNLAYQGTRANIPDFNCTLKKELSPGLPEINIVPQDISRVLLNLFNNAFYTVHEKCAKSGKDYKAIVELSTHYSDNSITISVKDNGNGIPKRIKEKIFEPFFTTKPAGQGTGLGLSLSYDIITKGHGGKLKVETKEGEGSEFIIQLLVNM